MLVFLLVVTWWILAKTTF